MHRLNELVIIMIILLLDDSSGTIGRAPDLILGSWVHVLAGQHLVVAFGKLLTLVCLCYQAVYMLSLIHI